MSKKLFVILGVLLLVVLSYGISLAAHPRTHVVNARPDQEPSLRPDRQQGHPWLDDFRVLPNINVHPDQEPLLRPDVKVQGGHPWDEWREI